MKKNLSLDEAVKLSNELGIYACRRIIAEQAWRLEAAKRALEKVIESIGGNLYDGGDYELGEIPFYDAAKAALETLTSEEPCV